jgi:hypothetical protein
LLKIKCVHFFPLNHKIEKRYQECYETYQKAIEWLASNDEEKGHVLVAMAAMIYAFQSADDAKTVLFQW